MNKKKNTKTVIGILLLAASVICAVIAVARYEQQKNAGSENKAIQSAVESADSGSDADPVGSTPSGTPTVSAPSSTSVGINGTESESQAKGSGNSAENIPVNFTELKKNCPDAYAWIKVDGTDVDYPIVQADGDQSYYLTHSAEKKRSAAGAIYTENLNSKDFTDPVTVIYGHNMRNGSMFRTLHRFEDRAFFNQHRDITVYLPQKVLHFYIFAAYNTDDRHILRSYDFSDKNSYQAYLDNVASQKSMSSIVTDDVSVTTDSHIIVLSTCNGNSSQRFLVQAVEKEQ